MASGVETPQTKIVCYFTSWAFYRVEEGKFLPENVDPSLCTHINYAFAFLDSTSLKIVASDPWADLDNQFYKELNAAFKLQKPALLLTIAMSANVNVMKQAYDVPNIFKHLDFANLMAYDYAGSWSAKTGHHSPLQKAYGETDPTAS
ncbi:hypothetical protein IscW_ISCW002923, partial [Ixodes scapularis]